MDELLTVSSTRHIQKEEQLVPTSTTQPLRDGTVLSLESPEDVLTALEAKPSSDVLTKCLKWLDASRHNSEKFHIAVPTPRVTQIVHVLVNEIVPSYWPTLRNCSDPTDSKQRKLLLRCLRSIVGIGALALRLRTQISARSMSNTSHTGQPQKTANGDDVWETLDVIDHMLQGHKTLGRIWSDTQRAEKSIQRTILWKELINWLSRGKLLSIAGEAVSIKSPADLDGNAGSWVGDGRQFCTWLGQNTRSMCANIDCNDGQEMEKAQILGKATSLGYTDNLVAACFSDLLNGEVEGVASNLSLLRCLAKHEQRIVVLTMLRLISRRLASCPAGSQPLLIRGVAALLQEITKDNQYLQDSLLPWLTEVPSAGIELDISVHHAVFTALSSKIELLTQALQKLLTRFGDTLYIQNSPILHQEICTQDLLILIGIVQRYAKEHITSLARSSVYINAISKRLAASSIRAQFLGMVLGMAVSELVDPTERRMKFSLEEFNKAGIEWYRSLTSLHDQVGSIRDLKPASSDESSTRSKEPLGKVSGKSKPPQEESKTTAIKKVAIEEIEDGSDSDTEDLPVYEKPDSDEEDEEEDPTLIERNKPKPPVYIRDLIAGLRDMDNYERHRLAVLTAANLIRRKTNFGTEVADHVEDLASQLTNLKDQYNMDNFQTLRLQAMIATVVAKPLNMGQWFTSTLFNGDYSMSQRTSILTALTMAARELAGYREEDSSLTGAYVDNKDLFPSMRLPEKYDKIYRQNASPVNAISQKLEQTMIQPLALERMDKLTGPKALKVRTFSSRMEVEKKRKRPITNELAKIVADGFFFPLTGRYRAHLQTHGSQSVFATPFLHAHFLKTVALILSASGTSTLSLPALTVEFWSLLLHERGSAQGALPVIEALLFSFLTVLVINDNDQRRIAEDNATELLETQAWSEQVLGNERGGTEEGEKVRMLAAAVFMKTKEIVDKYQRLLMGEMVNYM